MKNTLRKIGTVENEHYLATVPGSKSYTNRALIIAAQRMGTTRIRRALICDDTTYLADALSQFGGLRVVQEGRDFIVTRTAKRLQAPPEPVFVGGAGTPARFLLAFAATVDGHTTVSGNPRLCERPMGDLLDSFTRAGISWRCKATPNCLPVVVQGAIPANYKWTVKGTTSSQFASSLLLFAAQQSIEQVEISITDGLVSPSYVKMTVAMMQGVGIDVREVADRQFIVVPGEPRHDEIAIEPDASGMSYALTAAALTRSTVTIRGIGSGSVQGDVGLVNAYVRMGCKAEIRQDSITLTGAPLHGINIDMENMPDVVLSLAIAASQASSATRITNIANLRVKECDRIAALCNELGRLGIRTEEGSDSIVVYPGIPKAGVVHCYDDHRVAMAFSLLGLLYDGISVDNPGSVAKSFPEFWEEMGKFCDHLSVAALEG